jgi:hypothetical protein
MVTAGSTCSRVVENNATSRMPTTNSGRPASTIMMIWMTPSVRLPRLLAETIAMPKATGIMTIADTITSTAELTIRSPTSSPTGRPLAMELPRWPVRRPPSQPK